MEDNSFSAGSITMAIISHESYEPIMHKEYQSNFAMVKLKPSVDYQVVLDQIKEMEPNLNVNAIESDENYQKNLSSMKVYIIVLAVFVLIISSLFVIGIMNLFLYKYLHDIAIMRAIGGDMISIKKIFIRIIEYMVGSACIFGYLLSILLNKVVLEYFNREITLIKGRIIFYYGRSFLISLAIFVIIYIFLRLTLHKSEKVLPIQALLDNEVKKAGKRKRKEKSSQLLFYSRLWNDWFLAGKLIRSKLKENILIIVTISLIIAFALVGGSLHALIQKNNSNYMKSQYLTDIVVTTSKQMILEEANEVRETLMQDSDILVSYTSQIGTGVQVVVNERVEDSIEYTLASLDSMYKQHIISNAIKSKKSIVVSDELAQRLSLKIGSKIEVLSPAVYGRDDKGFAAGIEKESKLYEFEVGNILTKEQMKSTDLFIDASYTDFVQPYIGLDCMFVSGNEEKAIDRLNGLRLKHTGLKWSNYQDAVEYGNKVIKERFVLLELVINFLIVIAGIGWYNSMRAIMVSHKKNYMYLRIQGISRLRLTKIIVIQMFYYLISGIIVGGIIGFGALYCLGTSTESGLISNINTVLLNKIVLFLVILCILQYPTMKKISARIELQLYS